MGDPAFCSINDPIVSFFESRCFHVTRIASGIGLRQSLCTDMFGSGQLGQIFLLLLFIAKSEYMAGA